MFDDLLQDMTREALTANPVDRLLHDAAEAARDGGSVLDRHLHRAAMGAIPAVQMLDLAAE